LSLSSFTVVLLCGPLRISASSVLKMAINAEYAEVRRGPQRKQKDVSIYFPAVSSINPVASRTSIFDPNSTGIAKVEASATS
jgi:hypothetical protein